MIKRFLQWLGVIEEQPEIEWKYLEADKEEQIQPVEIYKDGEYSHTVNFRYFTKEQIDKIREAKRSIR